ncbi:MAG: hypothetical protein ABIV43_01080, partial [Candidatus Saccharimonadales bacterium]
MTPALLAVATFLSTMAGGLLAIKNKTRLHYILGFTAGIILGVIAFDILPETFALAAEYHIDPTRP